MSQDFGHAIGMPGPDQPYGAPEPYRPGPSAPYQSYEPVEPYRPAASQPYGQASSSHAAQSSTQDEIELATANAQARALAEAGDLTGARTMLEEAIDRGALRLGTRDDRLAPLMVDLASIARKLGNLTEARNQLRRAYGIMAAASGPEHPTCLSIEGRLAAVAYRLGEPTGAYDLHLADAARG